MSIGAGSLLSGLQGLDFGSFGLGDRESGQSRRGIPGVLRSKPVLRGDPTEA
jgi:hypothetical protein